MKAAKPEICYLCGQPLSEPTARDHVPADKIFPAGVRQKYNLSKLLTILVHRACNESYSLDEEYFVTSLYPFAIGTYAGDEMHKHIREKFLAGRSGLSAEKTLKLMQLLNLSREQVEKKLAKPTAPLISHLQIKGEPMRLSNDGWVPGQSGVEPLGSTEIDDTPTARDLDNADDYQQETIDFLKDQQNIHRSAIKTIQDYLDKVPRAKVNRAGSTESPRRIDDNERSKTPGPRPDRFSRR